MYMMKLNLSCKVERKLNKENKEYYTIEIEEIGYRGFLSPTEVKLLKLLVDSGELEVIESIE